MKAVFISLLSLATLLVLLLVTTAISNLEKKQNELSILKEERDQLVSENNRIPELRRQLADREKLQARWKDLHRLRNEVRELREGVTQIETAQAENGRLREALEERKNQKAEPLPPDYIPNASFANVGLATPESAVQTFFWTLTNGDFEQFLRLQPEERKRWEALPPEQQNELREQVRKEMQKHFEKFPGFRIAGQEFISPNEIVLAIESKPGGAQWEIRLERVGNEWRVASGPGFGI